MSVACKDVGADERGVDAGAEEQEPEFEEAWSPGGFVGECSSGDVHGHKAGDPEHDSQDREVDVVVEIDERLNEEVKHLLGRAGLFAILADLEDGIANLDVS